MNLSFRKLMKPQITQRTRIPTPIPPQAALLVRLSMLTAENEDRRQLNYAEVSLARNMTVSANQK
jgi:hypothetical protein